MKLTDIIKAVRWCIDEEAMNGSQLASAYAFDGVTTDTGLMNNIITNKISDAVGWISLYAPAEMLSGSDEEKTVTIDGETVRVPVDTGILVDCTDVVKEISDGFGGGYVDLPADFVKLARARVEGWHRAVSKPITEDSEEYLQLMDGYGAGATMDRPQAVLIDTAVKRLELWPKGADGANVEFTYVAAKYELKPVEEAPAETAYALPPRAKPAFIYYLAFLLLSAYNDPRAARMLEIAKMSLGTTVNKV